MDEKHLLASVRYVELNPVVAGLCKSPWDWQFSSARAHLEGQNDKLVKVNPMLERISDWRNYLAGSTNADDAEKIRKHTRSRRRLGSVEFVHKLEALTGESLAPRRPGPKPKPG